MYLSIIYTLHQEGKQRILDLLNQIQKFNEKYPNNNIEHIISYEDNEEITHIDSSNIKFVKNIDSFKINKIQNSFSLLTSEYTLIVDGDDYLKWSELKSFASKLVIKNTDLIHLVANKIDPVSNDTFIPKKMFGWTMVNSNVVFKTKKLIELYSNCTYTGTHAEDTLRALLLIKSDTTYVQTNINNPYIGIKYPDGSSNSSYLAKKFNYDILIKDAETLIQYLLKNYLVEMPKIPRNFSNKYEKEKYRNVSRLLNLFAKEYFEYISLSPYPDYERFEEVIIEYFKIIKRKKVVLSKLGRLVLSNKRNKFMKYHNISKKYVNNIYSLTAKYLMRTKKLSNEFITNFSIKNWEIKFNSYKSNRKEYKTIDSNDIFELNKLLKDNIIMKEIKNEYKK